MFNWVSLLVVRQPTAANTAAAAAASVVVSVAYVEETDRAVLDGRVFFGSGRRLAGS